MMYPWQFCGAIRSRSLIWKRKREESSIVPLPITRWIGRPLSFHATYVITSTECQITLHCYIYLSIQTTLFLNYRRTSSYGYPENLSFTYPQIWTLLHHRHWMHSSMHWMRNCSVDHTVPVMHTTGNSSIDTSVISDTQRTWSFVWDLHRDEIRWWWWRWSEIMREKPQLPLTMKRKLLLPSTFSVRHILGASWGCRQKCIRQAGKVLWSQVSNPFS